MNACIYFLNSAGNCSFKSQIIICQNFNAFSYLIKCNSSPCFHALKKLILLILLVIDYDYALCSFSFITGTDVILFTIFFISLFKNSIVTHRKIIIIRADSQSGNYNFLRYHRLTKLKFQISFFLHINCSYKIT